MRHTLALAIVLLAACRSTPKPEGTSGADAGENLKTVVVQASTGNFPVHVEIAADPESQARGLMFRRELGSENGMLFVFNEDRVQTFWMHNTLIPLDMIFIQQDGTIAGIVPEATPMTDTPRSVDVPSRYVLEVNGGWSARKGVKAGDHVALEDALR